MSLNDKRVGENIKLLRMKRKLTQQDIAESVGVTKQTICKIEKTGSTNPLTLSRIADALHVDVKELYEPVNENIVFSYPKFISESSYNLWFADYIKPMIRDANDTVAESIKTRIIQKCRTDSERIWAVLDGKGFHAETYTHDKLVEACKHVWLEAFSSALGVFIED